MEITFDPNKSSANTELRGLSFECAKDFDFSTALMLEDTHKPYPERRFQALGFLDECLCMLVYTHS